MKPTLLLAILFSTLFASAQKGTISPNIRKLKNDTIIWKQDSLLHKEDFKARARSGGALGLSAIGIFLYPSETGGELVFYVEALFVKSKSYITKYSEYVLRHEQIHFDLCELYARMLRQKIAQLDFKKIKNVSLEMNKLYQKIDKEHWKEQNKYDTDTEHGLNSAKQKVWEEDIAARLKALDAYSSTLINPIK